MIGVILLNLGGPDARSAVKPFLYNLFSDREIIRLGPPFLQKPIASLIAATRSKKTIACYDLIGGKSPIREITEAQAVALEQSLNAPSVLQGTPPLFKVYVGMRYWHPFIHDTVVSMHRDGIRKIFALSLYPQYSVATTGSSVRAFGESVKDLPVEVARRDSWYDHPLYIESLIEKIEEGMGLFPERPVVLFSAHSLPKKFIDEGDPYEKETRGTIEKIIAQTEMEWYLSYQSKSGPVAWLEPSTEQMLHDLSKKGVKNILVVPISFVSDHIETLYEIDILYRDMAEGMGMTLKRAGSLNTSPTFIEALTDIVKTDVMKAGWL